MTAALNVRLNATSDWDTEARELLARAGVEVSSDAPVVLAAGQTVDDALAAGEVPDGRRLMVLADSFATDGVLRAVRAGASVLLTHGQTTTHRLVEAVRAAHHGDGRLPSDVLVRLLSGADAPAEPVTAPRALTVRQTAVLTLMADGHGNAAIARSLSCSEHTVKNVIYELMARLQVRNRSHAVARAVRAGLI
ncbi:DNA-binding NarL/FixJ family response regulator [Crossiella equi]|uniref:DNA-binding NarL/FixJ family response regulator n=1 Tax=Crossiella equi TaxID=130796 RepID=A0ABS5ARM6_9PSEU|nr:response regulator transcription factor [Crossiella equi]MBP2479037.1 DNA-binding NarL/FixJ family response regulator [Crossiella equi]